MGAQLYKMMEMGELVPTVSYSVFSMNSGNVQVNLSMQTVVLDLLAEAMIKAIDEGAKGYLLDAFPMNLEQAKAFEDFIGSPNKVIYLSLEQDLMISRLLERGNFDDKEDAINKRCATFQNECRPVLEKYADKLLKV